MRECGNNRMWEQASRATGAVPTFPQSDIPALVLILIWIPSLLNAQLAGRWRLSLESSRPMLAELVLDSAGPTWRASILFERPDSSFITLTKVTTEPGGAIRGAAPAARLELELKPSADGVEGTLRLNRDEYSVAGVRLDPGDEFYPSPPAFRLRQMVWGSDQSRFRIPGRWLAAIQAQGLTPEAIRAAYVELALGSGITPLTPDSLAIVGLYRAMGLYRRDEMLKAAVAVLQQVRQGITSDTLAARFDYLFRPAGAWQVDIHDVALARARRALRTVTWESARPALAAAGLLPAAPPAELSVIPLALYRLFALQTTDSVAFHATLQQMRTPDPESKNAVLALLDGYESASQWYVAVLRLLLEQPVFDSGVSIADRVAAFWKHPVAVPEVRSRSYGYPEGSARVGADSSLVRRLVQPLNAPAEEWWARHQASGMLAAIHRLPSPPVNTWLELPRQRYRLTSVGQAGAESFNGFLEPRDQILLDPSYEPLLALGTLVHEWQHLLHEHLRDSAAVFPVAAGSVRLTQLNPYLAEGLAEWAAEQILLPLSERYPLLRFGEAEKRLSLAEDNPHVLGYAMVRALNSALRDPYATLILLVKSADPVQVLRNPRVAARWRNLTASDRSLPRRGGINLIPETRFQLIDEEPDVLESHIRIDGIDGN
jgi:hypothetical protein